VPLWDAVQKRLDKDRKTGLFPWLIGRPGMSDLAIQANRSFSCNPATRGYGLLYREREVNHCPGCGRTHWIVGRVSAECAFCATALPFAAPSFAERIPFAI
jgi:hypothetical protein